MAESREFRSMLESKERELIALCDQQIQALNGQIREKESAVAELKSQLTQLQDDFKYNLGLLDARDAELAQYDISSAALEASVKEMEERLNVTRKALADAQAQRNQEKARADELEQIDQKMIADLEKEIEGLQRSKEELQAKAKQELDSTKSELKERLAEKVEELEEEHKKELDEATKKWKEKIAKAEARLAESVEELEAAEKKIETAEEKCKNLKKELEAARANQKEDAAPVSQKEDVDTASRQYSVLRESQNSSKEEELKSLLEKQGKEIENLNKQVAQLKENKDTNVQAVDLTSNLREQLNDMRTHHTEAVDLFKGEIDSLRNKLESASSQTRNLEPELGRLRKDLEDKIREQKEMEEKHNKLHDSYRDLQKELESKRQNEGTPSQGPIPQEPGLAGGGSGSSSSYPAPSPLMSPISLLRDDALRINQGKLDAENSQLRARYEELALQNNRMRDVVETMRLEMEALQRQPRTSPERSRSVSPIEKKSHAEVLQLNDEVKYLKSVLQGMADEIGDIRAGSPNVHCRRPPQRQPTSPKRSGVSPIRRPKSSAKVQSPSRSPPHAVRSCRCFNDVDGPLIIKGRSLIALGQEKVSNGEQLYRGFCSPDSLRGGGVGDGIPDVEIVNSSLRAQLEGAKSDMARVIKERDLLMELSNALRADLSKVLQSGGAAYAQNPNFGYSALPPSLTGQFQQGIQPGTLPKTANFMAGVSSSHDVANALRPKTISPGKTRSRSNTKAMEPDYFKPWGVGVSHGETRERSESLGLQMEGTSYRHERPHGSDNDPLHKGTSSQRARFKVSAKRKEELLRPKVRNWNIKDDHPLET